MANGAGDGLLFARFNTDGSLDASFGQGGIVLAGFGYNRGEEVRSIALQADGKIVATGIVNSPQNDTLSDLFLLRLNADGSLDSNFATGGMIDEYVPNAETSGNSVAVTPDGHIVVAGTEGITDGGGFNSMLAMFDSAGNLESSFGTDGFFTINLAPQDNDAFTAVALQGDGKIVAGGDAGSTTFGLIRYDLSLPAVTTIAATEAAVTASVSPAIFGQAVTFTATIRDTSGSATPTGSVQFMVDGQDQGAPVVLSAGSAALILSNLPVGPHTIAVTYAGDSSFAASDDTAAPLNQLVQLGTTTSISSSPKPAAPGQSLTFTAQVATQRPGGGIPTGQVTFAISGPVSLTATQPVNAAGTATYATNALPAGIYSVTATYTATGAFAGSASAPLTQKIAASTFTKLHSSRSPALAGQPLTITASITAPGATGTITFYVSGVAQARIALNRSGKAFLTLTHLSAGKHLIKAVYSGDATHDGSSSSFEQTVFRSVGRRA